MKPTFYIPLAWNNIKKNARLYVPNILTGIGLTAIFYIIFTLSRDERLREVRGGSYLPSVMPLGLIVIAILSCILLLYTNSFLMKQRNQEFGLYNVLGMEKRHIGVILFWETVIGTFFVLIGGLLMGIILYKFCALLICRILAVDSILGFYHVTLQTLVPSGAFFLIIYLLTYLFNRIHISRMKPVELLQSAHTGEKEPRILWPLLLIGIGTLCAGYYISVTMEDPLQAIELFFFAVILVIIGTYCLFITGNIAFLKLLKRSKKFYYQKKHMIAVSGLLYRMKQNAVGLASITILATMILIMASTTVSLYAGIADTIKRQYPHQISLSVFYGTGNNNTFVPAEDLLPMVNTAAEENGLTISFAEHQRYLSAAFRRKGNSIQITTEESNNEDSKVDKNNLNNFIACFFITAEDYQKLSGKHIQLKQNQFAIYEAPHNTEDGITSFTLGESSFDCTLKIDNYPISIEGFNIVDCCGFVVSDETIFQEIEAASEITNKLVFDFEDAEKAKTLYENFSTSLNEQISQYASKLPEAQNDDFDWGAAKDSVWDTEEYLYGMYGTLLFLGLLLSIVFLFATALIIYFKQISEGYEDRSRFQIMQKVGMNSKEVKAAIRSQILLVFFLPLLVAAVHVAFAFPILTKLLKILFTTNQTIFLGCTIGSLCIFAVIYVLIYGITAKIYYQIVR